MRRADMADKWGGPYDPLADLKAMKEDMLKPQPKACQTCDGLGFVRDKGIVWVTPPRGPTDIIPPVQVPQFIMTMVPCPACGGTGIERS